MPPEPHHSRDSPTLFDEGIELFNRCEFYDCHEVLEEVWTPTRQPERWFLQALIHFAVGFYHHQRGNVAGATRQLRKGLRKIESYLPEWGGVRTQAIAQQARRCLEVIERGGRIETFPTIERCGPYSGRDYLLEKSRTAEGPETQNAASSKNAAATETAANTENAANAAKTPPPDRIL